MSRKGCICAIACIVFVVNAGVSRAQSPQARDAWLMQNYHFTGPPSPLSLVPADPVVSDLQEIQNTLLTIMQRAKFYEDYEAALAAAAQAAENAQRIGAITERLQSAAAQGPKTTAAAVNSNAPVYLIALKDHTVHTASAYWTDRFMLNYITEKGAHVQVRLDLVDPDLSTRLNREKNLEFKLPH